MENKRGSSLMEVLISLLLISTTLLALLKHLWFTQKSFNTLKKDNILLLETGLDNQKCNYKEF